jgi:hypothetical protein
MKTEIPNQMSHFILPEKDGEIFKEAGVGRQNSSDLST